MTCLTDGKNFSHDTELRERKKAKGKSGDLLQMNLKTCVDRSDGL